MNIKSIKMVLRAIELESLSKAAEEYFYTPSAFSHIADMLETKIGCKILKRNHRGIELSENGKIITEKLKDIVESERRLFETVKALNAEKNRLVIGTYASISKSILPKIIKGFKTSYPLTQVRIFVGSSLRNLLKQGKLDIIFYDEKITEEGIDRIVLAEDKYCAVFPKFDGVLDKVVRREQLYRHTFILPGDSVVKNYFDLSRFKEIVEIDSDDDSLIVRMVREGIGITVLPKLAIRNYFAGIRAVKLEPELKRNLYAAFLKDNKKIGAIKNFVDYLKQALVKEKYNSEI